MSETVEATLEPPSRKPFPTALTYEEARSLTDELKRDVTNLAEKLQRAHTGRAWAALHYASWANYCRSEFKISRQRAYQLLDFVEIRRQVSTIVDIAPQNESQTRALKAVPAEKRAEVWEAATEKANGQPPTAKQVEAAVSEVLEPEPPVIRAYIAKPVVEDPEWIAKCEELEKYVSEELDAVYVRFAAKADEIEYGDATNDILSSIELWLRAKREAFRFQK